MIERVWTCAVRAAAVGACAAGLAGCIAAPNPADLRGPGARLMVQPAQAHPIPTTPAGLAGNAIAHDHVANLRRVCVLRGRQAANLQAYIRTIAKGK